MLVFAQVTIRAASLTVPRAPGVQELVIREVVQAGRQPAATPPERCRGSGVFPLLDAPSPAGYSLPLLSNRHSECVNLWSPLDLSLGAFSIRFSPQPSPGLGERCPQERRGRGAMGMPQTVWTVCGAAKY